MAQLPALAGLTIIVLLLCGPATSDAWGSLGHRIICDIAERKMSIKAKGVAKRLLGYRNLKDVCTWADNIRDMCGYEWTKPLHYVNIRDDKATAFDYERDCFRHRCVVGAIKDNVLDLQTNYKKEPIPDKLDETLKFLAHFMGDVHQPLHVGFKSDRGGKAIPVIVDPLSTFKLDLHQVWDTTIIAWALWARHLQNLESMVNEILEIKFEEKEDFDASPYSGYATESFTHALKYAYQDLDGKDLRKMTNPEMTCPYMKDRYDNSVKIRLAQAGWRLAQLLNFMFDPPPSPSLPSSLETE